MNLNEEEFLDKDTEPRTYNPKPITQHPAPSTFFQCQMPVMLNQAEYLRLDPGKFKVLKGFFG